MKSAYYALVLGDSPFSNLSFYQMLLFRLYLRKSINNLVIHFHGQVSVKIELVMYGLVFMKFRKLRNLCQDNKKLDFHKTLIFSLFKSFPILLASSTEQKPFTKN